MTKAQKEAMFAYMASVDDPSMPDGAWQAMLEEAAEQWGFENNIDVDGFDAFMDYV